MVAFGACYCQRLKNKEYCRDCAFTGLSLGGLVMMMMVVGEVGGVSCALLTEPRVSQLLKS